jgi:hypothetical protein
MIHPLLLMRALRAWYRLRTYSPQKVTLRLVVEWLRQYPHTHRPALLKLLENVVYLSEREVATALLECNEKVLSLLKEDGVELRNVIYVQIDDPGSSSPVMLNLLRDRGRLERSGAHFVDGRDQHTLTKLTSELERGAIVYVDDFAGTGNQFVSNRNWASQFVLGTFSEFFICVVACEEAIEQISTTPVVPVEKLRHAREDRPLHQASNRFAKDLKAALSELGHQMYGKHWLGYRNIASSVVLYRNAPNTTPLLLRGSIQQEPHFGVLPRTTDLKQME